MGDKQIPFEELLADAERARANDTGLCDDFDPVDVSGVPAHFPAVHGPLCGCNSITGWENSRELCTRCGRHRSVHE